MSLISVFGVLRKSGNQVCLRVVSRKCETRCHVCALATGLLTIQRSAWTLLNGIRVDLSSLESVQLILSSCQASTYALPRPTLSQHCQSTPTIRHKTDFICDKTVAGIIPTLLPYFSHPKTNMKTKLHRSSVSVSAYLKLILRNLVLHQWKETVQSALVGLTNQSQSRHS